MAAFITTLADAGDVHKEALVTVKVKVPEGRFVIIVLDPDPGVITPPGVRVIVQLPAGRPLRTTLPVLGAHPGWVMAPTTGAVGVGEIVTEVPVV
jgi:hypothetical protein